ncbi:MAG: matrixin family metalloprotease [Chloroflexi bacterium]|nr:matrixin family metalloprotease [Chloroflexota bacterium]
MVRVDRHSDLPCRRGAQTCRRQGLSRAQSRHTVLLPATLLLSSFFFHGKCCRVQLPAPAKSWVGHELGHALGLAHNSGPYLMDPKTSDRYGKYGVYTPQADDIQGAEALYGSI